MSHKIAVIVGSLRKNSYSGQLANAFMSVAPKSLAMELVDISALSFFNQDLEADPPAPWVAFRAKIKTFDGVFFSTPEYNRSFPGLLKNAIDIGSRPSGKGVWIGKPAAVVSSSPGGIGGFGANHHLRQVLMAVNMPTLQQPEMYVGHIGKMFGPDGAILEASTKEFFTKFMETYAAWVVSNVKKA